MEMKLMYIELCTGKSVDTSTGGEESPNPSRAH